MKTTTWISRLPWSVVLVFAALCGLGWMAAGRCDELADGDGHFLRRQIVWTALGGAAMLAVSLPNYRVLCRWSYVLFLAALGLLVAVFFFPRINGVHRWIRIGPVGLQPAEFAKIAFVLAASRYLMYRENYRRLSGLLLPLAGALVPVLLVLMEPDLGMALLFLPALLVMLFAAGARRADLAILVAAGLMVGPLVWSRMGPDKQARVIAWFDQPTAGGRPGDAAGQLHQAKRMAALGGVWGSLVGRQPTDDPGAYRLPEARTDFVFCVVKERLGLPGAALVLGLYALLIWRGLAIAAATREPFGRLLAVGIAAMFGVQAMVNVGMNVGLLPITGLPLPLVSYGGSSLLAGAVGLGLLLNVGLRPGYEVSKEPFRWSA